VCAVAGDSGRLSVTFTAFMMRCVTMPWAGIVRGRPQTGKVQSALIKFIKHFKHSLNFLLCIAAYRLLCIAAYP